MSDSGNQGVSGQNVTISGQNIAVGANSRIEQGVSVGGFGAPLADLQRAIESLDAEPATRQGLLATHAEIAEELQTSEPDKNRLLSKLASLREVAGPASNVAQAVTALAQVVLLLC